jgi:hypothetical protein
MTDEPQIRADEARELAIRAFQGEILGAALFGDLAGAASDEARREEFATLRRLEERTAETLRGLLRGLGVTPEPDPEFKRLGHDFAQWAASVDEAEYLATFEPTIASAMQDFVRLRSLVDPVQVPIMDEVIAHEEALRSYAEARIARQPDAARAARRHLERLERLGRDPSL